jgi:hypothetical protein
MELKSNRLIYLKGGLFLLAGVLAAAGVMLESPTARTGVLLAIAVWCFARCYYFAFYVIEHYVDRNYRFAGLWSFAKYLVMRRRASTAAGEARRSGSA